MDAITITTKNISNVVSGGADKPNLSGGGDSETKGVSASVDADKPDPSGGGDNNETKVCSIVCFFVYDPFIASSEKPCFLFQQYNRVTKPLC